MKLSSRLLPTLLGIVLSASGCRHASTDAAKAAADPAPTPAPAAARTAPVTPEQLARAKVNEAGVIPILEYHEVGPREGNMKRSVENFRRDLDRLYSEGYRPILLRDYLDNRISAPLGTTPVVLTFDDARGTQFRYLPDGSIDPNCAIGILQEFAKRHPDFPLKATFYILPDSAFGQPKYASKKLQALLAMGCELGNHTVTHSSLKKLSDTQVVAELGGCVVKIHKLAPGALIDTVALPMGISPRNRALLAGGSFEGETYKNRAVLLVGAEPAPSPVSPKFKPMALPRIQATEGICGSTYWLDRIKAGEIRRYVSDGDPAVVTVPAALAARVDKQRLNGASLRTY